MSQRGINISDKAKHFENFRFLATFKIISDLTILEEHNTNVRNNIIAKTHKFGITTEIMGIYCTNYEK